MEEKEKTEEKSASETLEESEGNAMLEKIISVLNGEKSQIAEEKISKESEYLEKLLRLQAEFENFRKRVEKEKQEQQSNANTNLIGELLNVMDNFELSLKHNKDKGVEMIYQELKKTLEKQGLKVIETKGKFDPKIHEAVIKIAGKEDDAILEEIQKGYVLNNKLLRAAKVKISKLEEKK